MRTFQVDEYTFRSEYYYDSNHGWARDDGDLVTVGLTDFAQKLAGAFIHIALPRVGKRVVAGKPLASVESGKWVGRVHAPVSGEVVEVNEELDERVELLNLDPYDTGWIARIAPDDKAELCVLLKGEAVREFILAEKAKHSR